MPTKSLKGCKKSLEFLFFGRSNELLKKKKDVVVMKE